MSSDLKSGDWVTFRHQAVQRYGWILQVDPLRRIPGYSPGAALVRMTNTRGGQTSVWISLERLTRTPHRESKSR